MLTQVEIELQLPEGMKLNQSMGSVMQGVLMEKTDPDWAEQMHQMEVRPYSQYVVWQGGKALWRLQALTDEALERLILPMERISSIYVKQRGEEIGLSSFQVVRETSFRAIEEAYWGTAEKVHHIDMQFLTSASCKNQGGYAIFPMPHLIFKNLVKKWNTFSDGAVMTEDHITDHLAMQMDITGYQLHMHPFSLEGRRIRAFRGQVRYGLFKSDSAGRLAATLAHFATFAGTGMKTSMGMGATESTVAFYQKR